MVGIELPTVAGNGTLFRGAADVVFRPAGFTGTITDDWTSVPWCNTDFANYGNTATDHLADINDPVRGVGDICRHMGVIDSANWRMPTAAEIAELYGSDQINGGEATIPPGNGGWVGGSFHPLSGRAFGPHQTNVAITGNGANARVTNADPNTNGAVFLPASGFRHPTAGAIYSIGLYGYYWCSTAQSAVNGYDMGFDSTVVNPQRSNPRTLAMSIRCIRE